MKNVFWDGDLCGTRLGCQLCVCLGRLGKVRVCACLSREEDFFLLCFFSLYVYTVSHAQRNQVILKSICDSLCNLIDPRPQLT